MAFSVAITSTGRRTSHCAVPRRAAYGLTRLCEAGQPDWVIQAQIGHVSPQMMKTYSHIRRQALDQATAVLEPTFAFGGPTSKELEPAESAANGKLVYVTGHVTIRQS